MIRIVNVTKKYNSLTVFRTLSMGIEKEKITVILGGSGVGKSTLLNMIAGTDTDFEGLIGNLPERISYCFQEERLLPWKSVRENIEFVLEKRNIDNKRIEELMKLMGIYELSQKRVTKISGGQMQRTAICRALAYDSEMIFLDEPFKSLDISLRYKIIKDFAAALGREKRGVVLVTHNIDEALLLGDIVYIFAGTPAEIDGIIEIDIPKNERNFENEKLLKYEKEIYRILFKENIKHIF